MKIHATTIRTSMLALALLLGACGDAEKPADKKAADKGKTEKGEDTGKAGPEAPEEPEIELPPLDPKVEKAVSIANDIAADPAKADSILEQAGMDREAFEKLLYEIARDPELSKSYAIAREA